MCSLLASESMKQAYHYIKKKKKQTPAYRNTLSTLFLLLDIWEVTEERTKDSQFTNENSDGNR